MTAHLGQSAILLALCVAAVGAVCSLLGGRTGNNTLSVLGRRAAFLVFALMVFAVGVMEFALITHDFSLQYVADVGSKETPLYYTVISLWGALEGSILFWGLLLSAYTVAFLLIYRNRFPQIEAYTTGVLLCISTFFLFVTAGPGNPFLLQNPIPTDGPGPNPLLQNHPMMGLHPPLLYLGYVGLSVPYAIAMASLLAGAPGSSLLQTIRRWSLIPWIFLTLGIVAGMWWSYAVLGWGGYWSWDPVENASVMPWLVTTAFLHSLQVQERRQMLKTWTISLIIAAFLLSVLGTFLTRSGVVSSVHSFTQSGIGPTFLVFLAIALVLSLGTLFVRSTELQAPRALDAVVARESAFLFNNVLLVGATLTILLGTLFPLVAEALNSGQLSVGAPYFNQINVPVGVALLFLMGVGPALPWGAARFDDLQWRFLGPVLVASGTVLLLLTLGVRGVGALVTFGLSAFVLAVTLARVVTDVRTRRGNTAEGWLLAARRLFRANPRRYGGYLVHLGVLLVVVGIATSQVYGARGLATLHPNQSMTVDGYTLTYRGFQPLVQPNRTVMQVNVQARRGSQNLGLMHPSLNFYPTLQDPVVTPAVREEPFDLVTGVFSGRNPLTDLAQLAHGRNPFEDLYLVLQAMDTSNANTHRADRAITLQVLVNPMVGFIWLGGLVMGLGGAWALLPLRRRTRPALPTPVPSLREEVSV